ncbi:MAG: protein translocase subunit SecD [Candidatus Wallbacteria bacterium]|nr:protein translocase subunit SecD [Candidatus Wallbacteria bacterium]
MTANLKFRIMIIFLILGISLWFLFPTARWIYYHKIGRVALDKMSELEIKDLKKGTISLGLDLQGGVDLLYSIDDAKMLENMLWKEARSLKDRLERDYTYDVKVDVDSKNNDISIQLPEKAKPEELTAMRAVIDQMSHQRQFKKASGDEASRKVTLHMDVNAQQGYVTDAVDKALEIIRNRVDMFSVSEPAINRVGKSQIGVQLPGVSNVKDAIDIIGTTAQLQFRLVRKENGMVQDISSVMQLPTPEQDEEIVYGVLNADDAKTPVYILKKETLLSGEFLTNATIVFDQMTSRPQVSLAFDKEGGQKFYDITSKYTKWQLAIVLDEKVQSAPVIDEPIPNGNAVIRGNFTDEEAKKLAIVLRAGSLPAPLRKDSEITVGPSLGSDSITKGVNAVTLGFIAILIYMIVYYKFSGFLANVALFLNLVITLSVMAVLKGTLTLPGLAGLVLTIGMAVDANILIFERIKEEMRAGKTPRAAIDAGFNRAFTAIFDSNLTTVLSSLVLYLFGTGPIKGFAVTLGIGICASMFTALTVVHVIMESMYASGQRKTISI